MITRGVKTPLILFYMEDNYYHALLDQIETNDFDLIRSAILVYDQWEVSRPNLYKSNKMEEEIKIENKNEEVIIKDDLCAEAKNCNKSFRYFAQKIIDYLGEDRVYCEENIIILYYPKFTVISERSNVKPHNIYENYICLNLRLRGSMNITFTRTKVTKDEFLYRYLFSHARSAYPGEWTDLCFGSGDTPIKIAIDNFSINYADEKNEIQYNDISDIEVEAFIMTLQKYFCYESITGVPYKYIDKIGVKENKERTINIYPNTDLIVDPDLNNLHYLKSDLFNKILPNCQIEFIDGFPKPTYISFLENISKTYYAKGKFSACDEVIVDLYSFGFRPTLKRVIYNPINACCIVNENADINDLLCNLKSITFKNKTIKSEIIDLDNDDKVDNNLYISDIRTWFNIYLSVCKILI